MTNLEVLIQDRYIEEAKAHYSMINIELLPAPIQKMMAYPMLEDYEEVIKFLVGYFSYNHGWSLLKVKKLMQKFYSFREPFIEFAKFNEIVLDSYGKYSIVYYPYKQLSKKYGRIDFKAPNSNKIRIPNKLINNLGYISNAGVKIYTIMIMNKKDNIKELWSREEIANAVGVSERTIYRNIKALMKFELVEKVDNSSKKDGDKFRIKDIDHSIDGITIVDVKAVRKIPLDDRLESGALKVFLLLNNLIKYRILDSKCYDYQKEIGEFFDRTVSRVSELTTSLCTNGYINKETYYVSKYNERTKKIRKIRRCTYSIIE